MLEIREYARGKSALTFTYISIYISMNTKLWVYTHSQFDARNLRMRPRKIGLDVYIYLYIRINIYIDIDMYIDINTYKDGYTHILSSMLEICECAREDRP